MKKTPSMRTALYMILNDRPLYAAMSVTRMRKKLWR
jgi:hypothetical protein